MVKDFEEAKKELKQIFTGLNKDGRFIPTSKKTWTTIVLHGQ